MVCVYKKSRKLYIDMSIYMRYKYQSYYIKLG